MMIVQQTMEKIHISPSSPRGVGPMIGKIARAYACSTITLSSKAKAGLTLEFASHKLLTRIAEYETMTNP